MQIFQNIQNEIEQLISSANTNVKVAVTWFTNHDLYKSLLDKRTQGVSVDLIILNDRINNKAEGLNFQTLIDKGGSFYFSSIEKMVHHKFCIIDDSILITGSYNWTYYAENRNWENVVILRDPSIVQGFVLEFDKIKNKHSKVEIVDNVIQKERVVSNSDYIKEDYLFQAKREEIKGNMIEAAKAYTEVLKIDNMQNEALVARSEIISKFNKDRFEVCPFEIGINYKYGYQMAIPSFIKLPYTVLKNGSTTINNQENVSVKIQKFDFLPTTMLEFVFNGIRPSPTGTKKISHELSLDEYGILKVVIREVEGNRRIEKREIDIRQWLY